MPTYQVSVTRVTYYEVVADNEDDAVDAVLYGNGVEVDGETTDAVAYGVVGIKRDNA